MEMNPNKLVKALRQCAKSDCSSCGMCPIFPDRECVEPSRLRELAEADKDGRVVVQPCKIGDKLYRVFAGEIFEHRVGSMKYFAIQGRWDIETYPFCPCVESSIGKTVFLTHEEAKKALQKMEDKKDG